MNMPYQAVPQGFSNHPVSAPNAALLIDFDNVTMGMRSDLSKDLRKLLDSDIIRGKVTVQRAYADWRRYPQYIVPLSENSIDLIFAPAYGSSKKNATDIRMAIDGMELIFTRPEIGTFILLTGDSDFSSLVLKLKEYGKYVIGVGLQESSSDILVQNCDEYYSYTTFAGLQKTTEAGDRTALDPWILVEKALLRMDERGDVMRSDRLKQVMRELDPQFDEGKFGFSKFSRFVAEAASRDLLKLKRAENGQYDVFPVKDGGGASTSTSDATDSASASAQGGGRREREEKRGRGRGRGRRSRERDDAGADDAAVAQEAPAPTPSAPADTAAAVEAAPSHDTPSTVADATGYAEGIEGAYAVLLDALDRLREADRYPARGSDVKRRILEIVPGFDEAEYGFPKFSLFLKAAEDDGLIRATRLDNGGFEVEVGETSASAAARRREQAERDAPTEAPEPRLERTDRHRFDRDGEEADAPPAETASTPSAPETEPTPPATGRDTRAAELVVQEISPSEVVPEDTPGRRLGPRGGTTRRRTDGPPPLFEGQGQSQGQSRSQDQSPGTVTRRDEQPPVTPAPDVAPPDLDDGDDDIQGDFDLEQPDAPETAPEATPLEAIDAEALGLPTDRTAQIAYLTNSYRGIGEKTAEQVADAFGTLLFEVLNNEPERVREILSPARADHLLAAWEEDIERRVVRLAQDPQGG
ncbi:MAG: NYN domain-containing protein [Longimicrobiales bacterium]|nr:NYN domain-containing protein [Longimicrobiales bacterium]